MGGKDGAGSEFSLLACDMSGMTAFIAWLADQHLKGSCLAGASGPRVQKIVSLLIIIITSTISKEIDKGQETEDGQFVDKRWRT